MGRILMQVKELHNGKVLHLDEGHCEGLGVVDEGTQQQSAVQHPRTKTENTRFENNKVKSLKDNSFGQ